MNLKRYIDSIIVNKVLNLMKFRDANLVLEKVAEDLTKAEALLNKLFELKNKGLVSGGDMFRAANRALQHILVAKVMATRTAGKVLVMGSGRVGPARWGGGPVFQEYKASYQEIVNYINKALSILAANGIQQAFGKAGASNVFQAVIEALVAASTLLNSRISHQKGKTPDEQIEELLKL